MVYTNEKISMRILVGEMDSMLTLCISSFEAANPNATVAPPNTIAVAAANALATTKNHKINVLKLKIHVKKKKHQMTIIRNYVGSQNRKQMIIPQ